MAKRDYYEVLEVEKSATESEIKKAYRKVAIRFHPDKNPQDPEGAAEKFKEAAEAYEVLSDPEKRVRYDRFGHEGVKSAFSGGGFQWSDFHHAGEMQDIFGDIFNAFFGGGGGFGGGRRGPARGRDIRIRYPITLEEAFAGKEAKVAFERREVCETCTGNGAAPGSGRKTCPRCGGAGAMRLQRGFFSVQTTCDMCGGAGTVVEVPCPTCSGSGFGTKKATVNFDIPAGVDNGMSMRIRGEGEAAAGGKSAERGDLYVSFELKDHETFAREGKDVYLEYPLSFAQAALGAEISVPSLHGDQSVDIPPGTQAQKVFRLKGKGMPDGHGAFGDQYVRVNVVTPTRLTEKQKELFRELARELKEDLKPHRKKSFFQKVRDTIEDVVG
jgi:molecular chaperone DnaJ